MPGYTTAENVIYLSLRLVEYEPDLVLLYEGYNDFKPNRHPGFAADYAHWRDREAPPPRPWGESSRLIARMRTALAGLRLAPVAARDARTGTALPRHDDVLEEGVAVFARNLRTMIAAARASGGRVALVTWPHPCTEENLEGFPSQRDKHWFDAETFRGLLRLRGLEAAAPSGYAEAFHASKLVLGTGA